VDECVHGDEVDGVDEKKEALVFAELHDHQLYSRLNYHY